MTFLTGAAVYWAHYELGIPAETLVILVFVAFCLDLIIEVAADRLRAFFRG